MNQKGQTSVEYMLMIAVAIAIGIAFTKKMNEYMLTGPDSYINQALGFYTQQLNSGDRYKRFTLLRRRSR